MMNKLLIMLLAATLALNNLLAVPVETNDATRVLIPGYGDRTVIKSVGLLTEEEWKAALDEAAEALNELGIAVDHSQDELILSSWKDHMTTPEQSKAEMAAELLSVTGWGRPTYDETTYEQLTWTPTSKQVYAFDAEVYDIEHMYTWLLLGVESIVPGLHFDNVTEDLTDMAYEEPDFDWESLYDEDGNLRELTLEELAMLYAPLPETEGTRSVSFEVNGHPYMFTMHDYIDWVDGDIFDHLNGVLQAEGFEHQLYIIDGLSEIVYYGDADTAQKLIDLTKWW